METWKLRSNRANFDGKYIVAGSAIENEINIRFGITVGHVCDYAKRVGTPTANYYTIGTAAPIFALPGTGTNMFIFNWPWACLYAYAYASAN